MADEEWITSTAFLAHCTLPPVEYTVPSAAPPSSPVPFSPSSSVQSTWSPSPASPGFILSRLVNENRTLELRWVVLDSQSATRAEEDPFDALTSARRTLPPVHIHFPEPLAPSPPSFHYQKHDGSVLVYVLSSSQAPPTLYTLTLPPKSLFYSPQLVQLDWIDELALAGQGLESKEMRSLWGVDEGRLVVATEDGFNLLLELDEAGGPSFLPFAC